MDFLNDYATQIGDFLHWLSNPESTIPVAKLFQALAAIIGALISALGFYKAWRYAERKLGARLSEFLSREEEHLRLARKTVADIRDRRSAIKRDQPTIFSNHELRSALRHVRKRRFAKAETLLGEALARTTLG